MKVTVSKWGNSLAVRIPTGFAKAHRFSEGVAVEFFETPEGILLKPAKPHGDLSALLAQVTPSNLHASVDTGATRGKELW